RSPACRDRMRFDGRGVPLRTWERWAARRARDEASTIRVWSWAFPTPAAGRTHFYGKTAACRTSEFSPKTPAAAPTTSTTVRWLSGRPKGAEAFARFSGPAPAECSRWSRSPAALTVKPTLLTTRGRWWEKPAAAWVRAPFYGRARAE